MKKNLPSFASSVVLILFITSSSLFFIILQEQKQSTAAVNQVFKRYIGLIEKQVSQEWFQTAIRLGALYAAEKQLYDFSDDFFSKGVIHDKEEILGGFGFTIAEKLPQSVPHKGLFQGLNSALYYRIPLASRADTFITLEVNEKYLLHRFPSIKSISIDSSSALLQVNLSWFKTLQRNWFDLILFMISFILFALLIIYITKTLLHSRKEQEKNDIQNHDLRDSSFNLYSFLYWVKKYLSEPNTHNRLNLNSEMLDLEIAEEINRRIFTNTKEIPRIQTEFLLLSELQKIVRFVGVEFNLGQFKLHSFSRTLKVKAEINAFTVMLINLLKNALREIARDYDKTCELFVLEGPDTAEIFLINDGTIDNPRNILRKRVSSSGSTGLGLSIVEQQEKVLATEVTMVLKCNKVACSFPVDKVKDQKCYA